MTEKPEHNEGADQEPKESAVDASVDASSSAVGESEDTQIKEEQPEAAAAESASDDAGSGDQKPESTSTSGDEKPAAAAAKPEAKPAAKPAKAKAAATATVDTEVSRRGFFSWAAVAWVGFTAAIGGCMTAFGRFMFPNVLYEPPNQFKVGVPEDFPKGVVDERFKESNGVFIVNNDGELYALFAICTHLGCPPAWLEAQNKFKCPCHGSGYYKSGINFEGPTPRPLERAKIEISPDDGQIVVDKGQKYQWELGQWQDPNSYIALG